MQTEYEFDVFISYSSKDRAWVRGELLRRIEQAGLRAFMDFRDFTRGAPSVKEMERGVVKCRKTLLVLTPDYIKSGWCEIENIMLQTLDPANRDRRLIPLLKARCEKPLRIGALTHIDFTDGADLELAWRQLPTALGAPPEPEPPKEPQRNDWFLAHPYPMPPNFTGRLAERDMLNGWLNTVHPLLSLRALGGFGKSALAWHWLTHDVFPADWPRVVWWSFYEGDTSFDHFLTETLDYLSGGKIKPDKLSVNEVRTLLQMLYPAGTLLVLDGFERVLRAFGGLNAAYQGDDAKSEGSERDCISPLAEDFLSRLAVLPNLLSKVLLTTRLCPRALEVQGGGLLQGCREEELKKMQPADAVEFFRARGIRGTHTEIEAACEPYGYHPLSLRLLTGLVVSDFQQPGDIAAAKRLDVTGDLFARQHHVLETAYNSLTPTRQALLSSIACFRSPVKYEALKALRTTRPLTPSLSPSGGKSVLRAVEADRGDETGILDADLRDLVARGLLHHDTKEGRFDLHPIVRRYAYDRLTAPERAAAHTRLRDYFAAVPQPDKVTHLEDLAPLIELYHHTVRTEQFDEARYLYYDRIWTPIYYQLGAYQLIIDLLRALFPDGEDRPPRLKNESVQAWTLNELANSYSLSGQPNRAVSLYKQAIAIYEKLGDKTNLAVVLGAVAQVGLLPTGAVRGAEANLRRSIALCRDGEYLLMEALAHQELGRVLAYRGAWRSSNSELAASVPCWEHGVMYSQSDLSRRGLRFTEGYYALQRLLLMRSSPACNPNDPQFAIDSAYRALDEVDSWASTNFPIERNYVRAHWLMGAAHRVAGQHDEAERYLHEALERCRRINCVEAEADILIDLARLRTATGTPGQAQLLAEEALVITERGGYALQGADARLELAKLALARRDKATALQQVTEARRLATCDGPPDYTYKAAYDEAGALLAEVGGSI